jgi:hypothetical protein
MGILMSLLLRKPLKNLERMSERRKPFLKILLGSMYMGIEPQVSLLQEKVFGLYPFFVKKAMDTIPV